MEILVEKEEDKKEKILEMSIGLIFPSVPSTASSARTSTLSKNSFKERGRHDEVGTEAGSPTEEVAQKLAALGLSLRRNDE